MPGEIAAIEFDLRVLDPNVLGSSLASEGLMEDVCKFTSGGDRYMIIYGLSTCAVCQRARKELEAEGNGIVFRDVRSDPLSEAEMTNLIAEFGDQLVDRTTNDFRALNDWLKNSEVEAQISAKPKVMTRPVIQNGETLYLGWDEAVQSALLRR